MAPRLSLLLHHMTVHLYSAIICTTYPGITIEVAPSTEFLPVWKMWTESPIAKDNQNQIYTMSDLHILNIIFVEHDKWCHMGLFPFEVVNSVALYLGSFEKSHGLCSSRDWRTSGLLLLNLSGLVILSWTYLRGGPGNNLLIFIARGWISFSS